MIKYAVFDMDGTLFDTERLFKEAWYQASEKMNLFDVERIYNSITGTSLDTTREIFEKEYGDSADFDVFIEDRMNIFLDMIREDVPIKKGCFELLDFLRAQGIPCAVATSTHISITGSNLKRTGVDKYMDAVVTSADVEHGKPAPDIFLEAAKRIGACAEECIVLEDSNNGIRGAYAAGMMPIMIIDGVQPADDVKDKIFAKCDSMLDVIDIVKRENKI